MWPHGLTSKTCSSASAALRGTNNGLQKAGLIQRPAPWKTKEAVDLPSSTGQARGMWGPNRGQRGVAVSGVTAFIFYFPPALVDARLFTGCRNSSSKGGVLTEFIFTIIARLRLNLRRFEPSAARTACMPQCDQTAPGGGVESMPQNYIFGSGPRLPDLRWRHFLLNFLADPALRNTRRHGMNVAAMCRVCLVRACVHRSGARV